MNKVSSNLVIAAGKVNSQTARVVIFVLSLALFAIAAGAPDAAGGIGM